MVKLHQKGYLHLGLGIIFLLVLGVGVGTYLVGQQTDILPGAQESSVNSRKGWDYNLTHRCIKSVYPNSDNYYEDLTDCPNPKKNWTIAVESEKELLGSCPGPLVQSFAVNKPNQSPISINWIPHTDELGRKNWTVNLKTDMANFKHPCGAGYFTWVAIMDHLYHGGGPFPNPNDLKFTADVFFDDYLISGASRAMVGWQGTWDDSDDGVVNPTAKEVEVNFYISPNWGDGHPDEDIVVIFKNRDGKGTDYVTLDGNALNLAIPKSVNSKVDINFAKIIENLISRGIYKKPVGGWNNARTTAVYVSSEFKNESESNSGVANLYVTNFRADSISSPSSNSPSPTASSAPNPSCNPLPKCVIDQTCELIPQGDNWCPLPSYTPKPSTACTSDSGCSEGQSCQEVCTASYPSECKNICAQPFSPSPLTSFGQTVGGSVNKTSRTGDLDNNGDVDMVDLRLFVEDYEVNSLKSDFDNSGKVDNSDFNIFIENFKK